MLNLLDDITKRTAQIRYLRSQRDEITERLHAEEIALQRLADQVYSIRSHELDMEKQQPTKGS